MCHEQRLEICLWGLAYLLGFLVIAQGAIWCRPRSNLQLAGKSNRIYPRSVRTQPTWRLMSMTINAHCWMTLSRGVICYIPLLWQELVESFIYYSWFFPAVAVNVNYKRRLKLYNSQWYFSSRKTGAARTSASKRMQFDPRWLQDKPFQDVDQGLRQVFWFEQTYFLTAICTHY